MTPDAQCMDEPNTPGWPCPAGTITPLTKPDVNMKGWNCNAASSNQSSPTEI